MVRVPKQIMNELLIELYSEEIPPNLQVNAKEYLEQKFKSFLEIEEINYNQIKTFSSPTRLIVIIKGIPSQIKIQPKEIRGPKAEINDEILLKFINSNDLRKEDLYKKKTEKGEFYFAKTKTKEILVENILQANIPKILHSINWKKSMKWSNNELIWGRPLRSILAIFQSKVLNFNLSHIKSTNKVIIEQDLFLKEKTISSFKEYKKIMKQNNIVFDQEERERKILNRFNSICKSKNYIDDIDKKLLKEVVNLVEHPNVLMANFDKKYLQIPSEIIIATLKTNQRYFPLFNNKNMLTNNFLIVSNKPDKKNLIKLGNKRVVEARLSDAKFFWDKDKSKNLIKQINKLKDIMFFEKIGTIYDKTQRLRKLAGFVSDELNINKEKVEVAASISKSDLSSDLVREYPELQGVMGKYFAISQGFEEDVASAVSEHYLPIGNDSTIPKKPISFTISIADKIDSLVAFFAINEKPSSSKDPFALRRSAIGLLRIIIENKLNLKIKDLINYDIRILEEQGVKILNENADVEVLNFLKDRMRNILKDKEIKFDIIEAALSSHRGDNYFDLFKKNVLMNKYIKKEMGINVISSYRRAYNIIEKEGKNIEGRPDAVLFRKDEEKNLFKKINEIRKEFTVRDKNKDYENLLKNLSETKQYTDNFFNNVIVNDENKDIKNNRLELLKMFCNTFNNFINFSKLEGK